MSDHKDILDLDVKFRHIKMWLLHKRGLSRKEIAELLGGTNPGAVGNEIKKYEADPARRKMAEEQLAPFASSVAEDTLNKSKKETPLPPVSIKSKKTDRPISRATNAPSNPPDSSPAYLMTLSEYTSRVAPILAEYKKFARKMGWERSKNESGYRNYYGITLDISSQAGPALHIYKKYISQLREFFSQEILDSKFDKDEFKSNKRSVRRAIDDGTYEQLLNSNPDLLPKIEAAAASVATRLPQRLTKPRGNAITPAMYESLFSEIPSVNREILKELVKNVEESFKDFEEEIRQELDLKYRGEIKKIQSKDEIRSGEVNRTYPMVWDKLGAPIRTEKVKDKFNHPETVYYYKVPALVHNWESILAAGIESEIREMKMPMLRSILQNFEKITKRIKRFEKNDVRKEKGVFSGSFTFYFDDGSQFTFESKAIYAGGYNIQKLHLRYISDFSNARDAAGNKLSSKSLYEILLNFSDDKNKDAVANIYDRIDAAESVDKIIRELYEEIKKGRIKGLESPRANVRSLGYSIWEKQRKRSRALYFDGATGKGIMPLAEAKEKAITFLEGWGVEKASAIEKGAAVEAEHGKLYDEIVARLKAKGATMPMSREEFFKEIASAHLAEKKDYYELLEKYVEKHSPAGNSVGLKLPPSLKRKIDEYKSKGWFYGPLMETFLSKVDVKKLSDALTRTLKYANKSASHFGITNYQKKPMLEFVEIDEWDGNKFEKAPDYVPYLENVGDDVLFSYGTAAGTSDKPFLIWDIEDFIKLNPSRRPPTDEDSKYRGGGERLAGTGTKLNPANASTPEGGGLLVGVKHTPQGRGIEVETPEGKIKAEGGEILLNAKTSERLCEQLSAESVKDGGVAFPCEKTDSVQGPMKGDGGMAGAGDKINETNFKITTHEINDILSGKIKVRHGDSIQSAKALVGGSSGAQKSPQSEKPKRKEESRIRESGALLPSMFERSDAVFIDSGAEQSVYLKGDIVIKENTGVFYNTWEDYLNSLLLHNYFFEDTAYQFLGFEDVDGDINAIVSQPFVDTENKVNEDELFEFLKNKGFENTSGHDFEHPETGLILEDLHDENVIEKDGLLFFIDTVFFLPKSMSGDGTKIPVAAWTMPSGRIHHYAESIKNNHPKIWSTGGNEFGNQAYENLSRVLERGYWLQEEEEMYKRWRSFIARHQHDKRLPGIIANLKWLNFPNIGEDAAKEVIAEAVNKRMNGDGASIELKPYYTLTKEETIAERDAGTTRRGELNRHSIAEWGLILDELK